MNARPVIRQLASGFTAAVVILVLYFFTRIPVLPNHERVILAERFGFVHHPLPELAGYERQSIRSVHPSLERISAWISSVGAAVALADLDGDGLPNDLAYVDTRIDRLVIAPVPGTPSRYPTFGLDPSPLHYDPETMAPMGCLIGDWNEDGTRDLLVYYWGRTPIVFLNQNGSDLSHAGYRPVELVEHRARWFTNAATSADFDGDGHVDVVFGNYFPDDSHILDSNASGAAVMQHSMSRATNGGRNRLFLWSDCATNGGESFKFREAEGVFDQEVAHAWTLALGAADLDGDLLPELYFANDFGPDRLLHNRSVPGELKFTRLEGQRGLLDPRSKVIGKDSFKGMGVDFGDLNNDRRLDIYVSNIAAEYALEESHFTFISTGDFDQRLRSGIAPYIDSSESLGLSRSGWGWEARLADFDNDGILEAIQATGFVRGKINRWPELHELAMGNDDLLRDPGSWPIFQSGDDLSGHDQNPFFVRSDSGSYVDLSSALGLHEPGVSRGIATADVDGDGRLDFAVANQWESSSFYHNNCPNPGSFLGLHLLLPLDQGRVHQTSTHSGHPDVDTLGRPAVGAQATLTLPGDTPSDFIAQVDGGNGHSGVRSSDLHFGLGAFPPSKLLKVNLRWRDPDGRVQSTELQLKPGWYTIQLAWPISEDNSI